MNNKPILNLITFASVFQRQEVEAIRNSHRELFSELEEKYTLRVILHAEHKPFLEENHEREKTVVFIATGGTEGFVVKEYASLPHPLTLLTDGKANSLAASLELACWVRQQGDACSIIHGKDSIEAYHPIVKTIGKQRIAERIGVIGEPSDWLVSSDVDYEEARKLWGVDFVDIPLSRLEKYYQADRSDVTEEAKQFISRAESCIEPDENEIEKAVRLYHAIKRIVDEEELSAVTLQCFSLIPTTKTTGCLALALLNDEGTMAGCEGDLQSIFTMLMAKRATGVDGFMANPSLIDKSANRIILAHCTIGLKQTERYIVRSHFESQSGVAIQGIIPTGRITIVKCGGKNLSKYAILTGRIIENQNDPRKCRTQVLIELDDETPATYFFNENIGNHHIILQGDHKETLETYLSGKNQKCTRYQRKANKSIAVFAGGCFWGVQHYFDKMHGVEHTFVGYTGGEEEAPSYSEVRGHNTHHVEAVLVEYDNTKVTYTDLCKLFFEIHDPAQTDGVGPDIGPQYRSCIFFDNKEQEQEALSVMKTLRDKGYEVNTLLHPFDTFWIGEDYHQKHYSKTGGEPYCHFREKKF